MGELDHVEKIMPKLREDNAQTYRNNVNLKGDLETMKQYVHRWKRQSICASS